MSRNKCLFRQSDVTKALKAAVKAGIAVERVEIGTDGKIIVVVAKPNAAVTEKNEWDEV